MATLCVLKTRRHPDLIPSTMSGSMYSPKPIITGMINDFKVEGQGKLSLKIQLKMEVIYLRFYGSRYVYWGEYPLSFAACLGQEECYRLILARGADPDKQDTNGNTVLHMLVIYEKMVCVGTELFTICLHSDLVYKF